MSVTALSRLLKAVAKSIRHSIAMLTILATELFQARHDTAIATSKLLLENSGYELWNAPINAKSLFSNKIRKLLNLIMKCNNRESWPLPHPILTNNKKHLIRLQEHLKYPNCQTSSRPKQSQTYRSKTQTQSFTSGIRKDFNKRSSNSKQFLSSKQASSSTKF